jgi:hypothetical protein
MALFQTTSGPQPLQYDERGAIIVPALVMGALITGALMYVFGVGDGIHFRMGMQDAADVTAFKGAVWHARGMNALSVLNVLMTLVLAVFAILRVVEIVLLFVSLIPLVGELGPAETLAGLVEAEPEIYEVLNTVLLGLEKAEDGVSAAVPYVAFAEAKSTATAADTIWPFSMGLVPPRLDASLGQETRRPSYLPAALPVQPGKFGLLCGRAVTFLPNQAAAAADRLGLPGPFTSIANTVIDDVLTHVLGSGDGLFCQPIDGLLTSLIDIVFGKLEDACDAARQEDDKLEDADQEKRDREAAAKNGGKEKPSTGRGAGARRRANGSTRDPLDCGAATSPGGVAKLEFAEVPAVMWGPAANGNAFMHVWSWAKGQPRLLGAARQGIGIAGGGVRPSVTPSSGGSATGEYYFDCDDTWADHCKEAAPWAPNWTARIRRYRAPGEELAAIGLSTGVAFLDDLQASIGDRVEDKVGEAIHDLTGASADNPIARWAGRIVEGLPVVHRISQGIDAAVGGFREHSGLNDLLDPRQLQNPDRIH